MAYKQNSCEHQPQDGSGEPNSKGGRTRDATPAHPNPDNVEAPTTSATQTKARSSISPDEDKDEIDDSRYEEEKRDKKLQDTMRVFAYGRRRNPRVGLRRSARTWGLLQGLYVLLRRRGAGVPKAGPTAIRC